MKPALTLEAPRVVDNDSDEITVTLAGREIRGWSYATEAERRTKMLAAREFCEGWHHAMERSTATGEKHVFRAAGFGGESCSLCGANWRDTSRHLTSTELRTAIAEAS